MRRQVLHSKLLFSNLWLVVSSPLVCCVVSTADAAPFVSTPNCPWNERPDEIGAVKMST